MRCLAFAVIAVTFVACSNANMRGKTNTNHNQNGADALSTTKTTSGNEDDGKLGDGELTDGGTSSCIKEVPVRYDDGGLGASYATIAQSRVSCDSISVSSNSNGGCAAVITGIRSQISAATVMQPGDVLTGTLNGKALKFENGKAKIDALIGNSFDLRLKLETANGGVAQCATLFTVKKTN